jgi:hypothetical protein
MIALLVSFFLVHNASPRMTANRVPSDEVIMELERRAKLPAGASGLAEYTRYYTEADVDGRPTIFGQMIESRLVLEIARITGRPTPPPIVRGLEADIPGAGDGGCGVLNVIFDPNGSKPPRIFCNPTGPRRDVR